MTQRSPAPPFASTPSSSKLATPQNHIFSPPIDPSSNTTGTGSANRFPSNALLAFSHPRGDKTNHKTRGDDRRHHHVNPDDDDLLLNMAMMDGNRRRHDSTPREHPAHPAVPQRSYPAYAYPQDAPTQQPMMYAVLPGASNHHSRPRQHTGPRTTPPPPQAQGHQQKTRQRRLSSSGDAPPSGRPAHASPPKHSSRSKHALSPQQQQQHHHQHQQQHRGPPPPHAGNGIANYYPSGGQVAPYNYPQPHQHHSKTTQRASGGQYYYYGGDSGPAPFAPMETTTPQQQRKLHATPPKPQPRATHKSTSKSSGAHRTPAAPAPPPDTFSSGTALPLREPKMQRNHLPPIEQQQQQPQQQGAAVNGGPPSPGLNQGKMTITTATVRVTSTTATTPTKTPAATTTAPASTTAKASTKGSSPQTEKPPPATVAVTTTSTTGTTNTTTTTTTTSENKGAGTVTPKKTLDNNNNNSPRRVRATPSGKSTTTTTTNTTTTGTTTGQGTNTPTTTTNEGQRKRRAASPPVFQASSPSKAPATSSPCRGAGSARSPTTTPQQQQQRNPINSPRQPQRSTPTPPALIAERHSVPDKGNKLNLSARSGGKTEAEKNGEDPLSLLLRDLEENQNSAESDDKKKNNSTINNGNSNNNNNNNLSARQASSTGASMVRASVVVTSSQFQRRIAESILHHDVPQLERLFQLFRALQPSSSSTSSSTSLTTTTMWTTGATRQGPSSSVPVVLNGKRVVLVDDVGQPPIPIRCKGQTLSGSHGPKDTVFQPSLMDYVCDTETGFTLLHLAVLSGDKELVRRCLYSDLPSSIGGFCCPHRVEDTRGETALTLAMRQAPSCVRMLFDYSVEADRRTELFAATVAASQKAHQNAATTAGLAAFSAEEIGPAVGLTSSSSLNSPPSSPFLLAPLTNAFQRHVLGSKSTNLLEDETSARKEISTTMNATKKMTTPRRHGQLQPLRRASPSVPRSPSPVKPTTGPTGLVSSASSANDVMRLGSTGSPRDGGELDHRSGGIYRTTHLMRHTLLHCAVSADSFSPPWPERLAFIQMLVQDYGLRASQENAFGCTPAMWAKENAAFLGGGVKGTTEGRAQVRKIIRFLNTAARREQAREQVDPKRWLLRQAGVRVSPSRSPGRDDDDWLNDYATNGVEDSPAREDTERTRLAGIRRPFQYGEAEKKVKGTKAKAALFDDDDDEPEPQPPSAAAGAVAGTAAAAKKRVGFHSPPPVAPSSDDSSCWTSSWNEGEEHQQAGTKPSAARKRPLTTTATTDSIGNAAADAATTTGLYHRRSTFGVFSVSPSPRGPSLRSVDTRPPSPSVIVAENEKDHKRKNRKSREHPAKSEERCVTLGENRYAAALAATTLRQSRRQGSYVDASGQSLPREVSPSLRMALSYLGNGSEAREPSMLPHDAMNELLVQQQKEQKIQDPPRNLSHRMRHKGASVTDGTIPGDVQKPPTTAVKIVALPLLRMSLVTTPAEKVRWYLQGPTARLVLFAVLFVLHLVHNALDVSGSVQHVWRAELWGTVWNMLFSSWLLMTFFMGMIRLGLLIGFGIVLGYYLFPWFVGHWIGVRWLRIPLLGAQSIEEKNFERVAFGIFFSTFYNGSQRYKMLLRPIGVVGGIYIAAKVYNLCIRIGYPAHYTVWATIPPTFYSADSASTTHPWFYQSAWLTFWGLTFLLDVFALVFAMDLMHQQGALNVYLPDYRYDQFANWVDGTVYPWLQTHPRCCPGLLLLPARLHITRPWRRLSQLPREVWHAICQCGGRRPQSGSPPSSASSRAEGRRERQPLVPDSRDALPSDHFHLRRSVSPMSFRVWWFWSVTTCLLLLTCFPLFLAAGLIRHRYTYAQVEPVPPPSSSAGGGTLSDGTAFQAWCCTAVSSLAILCLVGVSLQEWHWPSHTVNASLSYPGGLLPSTYAHPSLLFLVLLMAVGTLDLRAMVQNGRVLVLYGPNRAGSIVALVLAILPAVLGVVLLLLATFSTSLRVLQRVLQSEASNRGGITPKESCRNNPVDGVGCLSSVKRRWRTFRTRSYEVWKLWAMGKHLFALPVPAVFGVLRSLAAELPSWALLEEQEEATVWGGSSHLSSSCCGEDVAGPHPHHRPNNDKAQLFWVTAAALAANANSSSEKGGHPHSGGASPGTGEVFPAFSTASPPPYLSPLFDPTADLTARRDAVYRLAVTEVVDLLESEQLLERIAAQWTQTEQRGAQHAADEDEDEDDEEEEREQQRQERLEDMEEEEAFTAIANALTPRGSTRSSWRSNGDSGGGGARDDHRIPAPTTHSSRAGLEEHEEEEKESAGLSVAIRRRLLLILRRRQQLAFWKKQQSRLRLLTYLGNASSLVSRPGTPGGGSGGAGPYPPRSTAGSSSLPDHHRSSGSSSRLVLDPKERQRQQRLYDSKREAYKQQMRQHQAKYPPPPRRSPSTRRSPSVRRSAR